MHELENDMTPTNGKITLTDEELDELKDTIKFREKVVLQLKQINGLPKQEWTK